MGRWRLDGNDRSTNLMNISNDGISDIGQADSEMTSIRIGKIRDLFQDSRIVSGIRI